MTITQGLSNHGSLNQMSRLGLPPGTPLDATCFGNTNLLTGPCREIIDSAMAGQRRAHVALPTTKRPTGAQCMAVIMHGMLEPCKRVVEKGQSGWTVPSLHNCIGEGGLGQQFLLANGTATAGWSAVIHCIRWMLGGDEALAKTPSTREEAIRSTNAYARHRMLIREACDPSLAPMPLPVTAANEFLWKCWLTERRDQELELADLLNLAVNQVRVTHNADAAERFRFAVLALRWNTTFQPANAQQVSTLLFSPTSNLVYLCLKKGAANAYSAYSRQVLLDKARKGKAL
jgi:hypothetical protein